LSAVAVATDVTFGRRLHKELMDKADELRAILKQLE
jgi:hypothetical protein